MNSLQTTNNQLNIDVRILLQQNNAVIEKLMSQVNEMQTKVDLYNDFLDANGEADCKIAASVVELLYLNPQGKKEKVDRNYFIQILKHDKIIYSEGGGYKLSASHKAYGRTKITNKNGFITNSVLFNAKGIDYLVKKYKKDLRTWHSVNGQICCQEAEA